MTTECRCGHTLSWHVAQSAGPYGNKTDVCAVWACYCEKYEVPAT